MGLTIKEIENAKPHTNPYKLADGRGLCLLVSPSGARLWRWPYRFGGKEKMKNLRTVEVPPGTGVACADPEATMIGNTRSLVKIQLRIEDVDVRHKGIQRPEFNNGELPHVVQAPIELAPI